MPHSQYRQRSTRSASRPGWAGAAGYEPVMVVDTAVCRIVIAVLVLLPETWAAVRAAHANRLQSGLNLALGSALSSIGLTIPAVAVTSTVIGVPLVLGLIRRSWCCWF